MKSYEFLNILQAHCQSPASPSTIQSFDKELAKPTQEKLFLKNVPTLQKNKKRHAQPNTDRQKSKRPMTLKLNTDNGLQRRTDRTPAANSVLPQLAVTCKIEDECYYQTLVLGDSEVLRNRQLRQHAKRYIGNDSNPNPNNCTPPFLSLTLSTFLLTKESATVYELAAIPQQTTFRCS